MISIFTTLVFPRDPSLPVHGKCHVEGLFHQSVGGTLTPLLFPQQL